MQTQVKGALFVLAGMFMFSVMSALVKLVSSEVSSAGSVFFRGLVGVVIVYLYAKKKKVSLKGKRKGLLMARAVAGTIALLLVFFAFTKIPTANAMLLNQTTPVFMVPLAVLFLKEKTSIKHILLVVAALFGVWMVLNPRPSESTGFTDLNIPGLLALLSAFFAAVAYLLVRKLTETEHSITIVFWFTLVSTVASLPLAWGAFGLPSPLVWLGLLFIGIFGAVGQLFLTSGYSKGEAGRLAVIGGMGAVFCALWDFIIFKHSPTALTVLGGVLVIVSCGAIQVLEHKKG